MKHELSRIKRINTYYKIKFKTLFVWFVWFVVNFFLLTTCVSVSRLDFAGLGKPQDLVPFSSKVLTGHLPNGLRYYILENSLPENRAHLGLIVNAGSVLETDEQRGYAHFVEHLAFSDTVRFPDLQIQEYLRSLGMRFGPDFNASTSHERTLYHFDIPIENANGEKRIPVRALEILDDWTHAVTFKSDFVDSERRVILEEMRARSGAQERIRKIVFPIIFAGSAFENREVIGLESTIQNATQDSLMEFYKRWYTADNMAIVFIGDFDGKALEKDLVNHFNMPKPERPVNRPRYELPPPKNGNFHVEIITDPEITQTSYSIYFKQNRTAKKGSLAFYRETIIDYLISFMLNRRFEEAATDPEYPATEGWGGPWYWAGNSKFYMLGATSKTARAGETLMQLLIEKESMKRGYGFTQSELDRAKLNLASYMERQLSEKDRRESRSFLRGFTSHFLYGEDFADIEWEVEAVNALLPVIGLQEIARAAANYFSFEDINIILTAPEAEMENLPSVDEIKYLFNYFKTYEITRRQDEFFKSDLLDTLPVPGPVTVETIDEETDAVKIVLSNGATLILKETNNRNNEIILYAMAKGGTVNAPENTAVSVNLLSEMTQVSGLGNFSRVELVNMLAGIQVSMSFWTAGYYRGFQGSSTTQDIKTLFEMLYIFFTNPRLEERAIRSMIEQYRTALMHRDEDPQRVFFNEVTKILTSNHPRFKPLEVQDLDRISINDAHQFLLKCLNPADYTFVFTGNFDIDTMRNLAMQYLGSIPDKIEHFNWFTDPNVTRPSPSNHVFNKGKDDRTFVYLNWLTPAFNQFNERRNQIGSVLSEYLDIFLTDEIREKLGGVYGISSSASHSVIPRGENTLTVYFVTNPERAEELITAVISGFDNLIFNGLDTDTFNKAKEAVLMQHQRSIQRNLHIAQSFANSSVLYNTPLSRLYNRPNVVQTVTIEEVQALLKEMLATGPVRIVQNPEGCID